MTIIKKIEQEIDNFLNQKIDLADGVQFSQYELIKRISLCMNQVFRKGKFTSQKKYKYWNEIIAPRVYSEVKNIDFDEKDVFVVADSFADRLATFLLNLRLGQWMSKNRIGEKVNEDIEDFSAWGNVVWKKIKDGYEKVDLTNFFVLNQTAKTLDETDVIERHLLSQSDLRSRADVWKNVDEVIKNCGNKFFKATEKAIEKEMTTPFYEIYERNGEVSEADLLEAKGERGGDKDKYVLAKIIVAGLRKGDSGKKYILFAEEIEEKPYIEAHRGKYEGRWFRKGLYEILFDCQMRANEIGNQIARGLEAASKWILRSSDSLIVQNALTDLQSGDIIKTKDLSQVETRMQGFDQLVADWNRNIQLANELANSYEVVTGESLPSGTPFRLGFLINQNANKLFDFLREKIAIGLERVFQEWILPEVMKEIRNEKIVEITGDDKHLKEYQEMFVNAWYINNLLTFPPHSTEQAEELKRMKLEEVKKNKQAMIEIEEDFWKGVKPRVKVVISGQNVRLATDIESLSNFIQLETDSVRRTALLEMVMAKMGIDITSLPKSPQVPQASPLALPQQAQQTQAPEIPDLLALRETLSRAVE